MRDAALAAGIAMPGTVILALPFLLLGSAATILMYRLWAYPFDKVTRISSAALGRWIATNTPKVFAAREKHRQRAAK